jgi:hypothetical protein
VSRLAQQWPDASHLIATLPIEQQARLARNAASAGLAAVQLTDPGDREALTLEVQRLDEIAWELQQLSEFQKGSGDQYDEAFRRARAMNATLFARYGDPEEAIYEALHALPDGFDLTSLLDIPEGSA